MAEPLRVLIVDDSPDDCRLVVNELRSGGFEVDHQLVDCDSGVRKALAQGGWDIVVCDYSMPGFGGLAALALVQEADPDLPFILISGTMGEEIAVAAMRAGACDYIVKEHLPRLVPAVQRELREARTRRGRRAAEEDLRVALAKYKALFESFPLGITVADRTGRILESNLIAGRLLGLSQEELDQRRIDGTVWRIVRPDGTPMPSEEYASVRALKEDRLVADVEMGIVKARDQTTWISVTATPLPLEGYGVVIAYSDITERKRTEEERRKLESQVLQAHKMESVGRLAGGVAHDFNNLLTAILGYTVMAMDSLPSDSSARPKLAQVQAAGLRAADLTRQLLLFSRRELMEPLPIDLNRTIDNMLKMLCRLIGEDIKVTTALGDKLWTVRADAGKIEQVVMNLAVNARDAMPAGGSLALTTANAHLDALQANAMAEARAGDFVRVSLTDTGTGIGEQVLGHLFEPFFTTKGAGKGTGLGLSVVYGIVKQHEGWIHVTTQLGKGTTFAVYLPAAPGDKPVTRRMQAPVEALRGGGERVLLIEDDELVRDLAKEILADNGYEVVAAGSLAEGLRCFREQAGRFALLFTDVVLPDGTGLQVVDQVLATAPHLPVLLASGYTDDKSQAEIIHGRGLPFLRKPYGVAGLLAAVRGALSGKARP